jgi:hypothetical protein
MYFFDWQTLVQIIKWSLLIPVSDELVVGKVVGGVELTVADVRLSYSTKMSSFGFFHCHINTLESANFCVKLFLQLSRLGKL